MFTHFGTFARDKIVEAEAPSLGEEHSIFSLSIMEMEPRTLYLCGQMFCS